MPNSTDVDVLSEDVLVNNPDLEAVAEAFFSTLSPEQRECMRRLAIAELPQLSDAERVGLAVMRRAHEGDAVARGLMSKCVGRADAAAMLRRFEP